MPARAKEAADERRQAGGLESMMETPDRSSVEHGLLLDKPTFDPDQWPYAPAARCLCSHALGEFLALIGDDLGLTLRLALKP